MIVGIITVIVIMMTALMISDFSIEENSEESEVVVTGDIFGASTAKRTELRERLGADAVEMEGAAVAQICYQQKIPCIVIRGISDKADEKALEDVEKYSKIAAENAASLVVKMIEISDKVSRERGNSRD